MESLKYHEEVSTKEELSDLKNELEIKLLKENPKVALLNWFSKSKSLPIISGEKNDSHLSFSTPTIVEDAAFNELVNGITEEMKYRTSLYTIEDVLREIALPEITIKYVAPDGKDLILKFKFEEDSDKFKLSPFVKNVNGGNEMDIVTDSKYTIVSRFNPDDNFKRMFNFELKK